MSIPTSSNSSIGSIPSRSIEISNPLFSTLQIIRVLYSFRRFLMEPDLPCGKDLWFLLYQQRIKPVSLMDLLRSQILILQIITIGIESTLWSSFGWLLNSLSKEIVESVLFLQTAKEIWNLSKVRTIQWSINFSNPETIVFVNSRFGWFFHLLHKDQMNLGWVENYILKFLIVLVDLLLESTNFWKNKGSFSYLWA